MELTNKQQEGLKEVLRRYKNGDKYVVIGGYAGTGKSTLVRVLIEALGIDENKVAYVAYTGKAAEVLRQKGNKNSLTAHKLLYNFVALANGKFIKKPKLSLEYSLIIVDEVSMLPKSMVDLLLKHNAFCIFLGDPFQLPQISKDENHGLLDHPHVFLDQVMRQAAESEIIRLTMAIREGKTLEYQKGDEAIVIPKRELVTGHLTWADQILCATNKTRISINNQIRQEYGYEGLPQDGEKMICLRNNWDYCSEDGESVLVNGMTGIIHQPFETFRMLPPAIKIKDKKIYVIQGDFTSEDGHTFSSVEMDEALLFGDTPSLPRDVESRLRRTNKKGMIPEQFTFGYCITCHKAQGSEWNKVTVLEENFPFDKTEHARWLYTACTRSAQKLVLVKAN